MHDRRPTSRQWITNVAAAGLAAFAGGISPMVAGAFEPAALSIGSELSLNAFTFAHDDVLGTSMDMIVCAATSADAAECHRLALAEIERLRAILSTFDPASEISRVRAGAAIESPALHELLAAYDQWSARTSGAIDVNMASVIDLWKQAGRENRLPQERRSAGGRRGAAGVQC